MMSRFGLQWFVVLVVVTGMIQSAWPQAIVSFEDADLERLVRQAIGRPQGPIYSQYLRGGALIALDASNSTISSLSGLEYAVDLEVLNISGNTIRTIDPLSALTRLRVLNLANNRVSAVTALQSLTRLENLNLANNMIASLEPLLQNTGLDAGDTLDVRGNPLGARTLCGVLATFTTRGATVLATGSCGGTVDDPGAVDQQPDLYGTLRAQGAGQNEVVAVGCGAVEVYRNRTLVATAVTDDRGYFFVEGLEPGQIYDLVFHAQGYNDVVLDNLVLQPGGHEIAPPMFENPSTPVINGTILLTVFDEAAPRPPVAGALVRAFQFNVEIARTTTCATGYFEFDNATIPFPGMVQLRFSAGDFVPEPLDVILPAFDLLIGLEKLTFPNSIVGVVVNARTGAPIEGAQVLVQPSLGLVTHVRTTDSDGAYVVENVDDGEYSAHATAEGFDSATQFGFVRQDLLQIDLELTREGESPVGCAAGPGSTRHLADMLPLAAMLVGLLAWRRQITSSRGY